MSLGEVDSTSEDGTANEGGTSDGGDDDTPGGQEVADSDGALLRAVREVVVARAHVVVRARFLGEKIVSQLAKGVNDVITSRGDHGTGRRVECLHLNNATIKVSAVRVVEFGAVLGVLLRVAEGLELLEGVAAV